VLNSGFLEILLLIPISANARFASPFKRPCIYPLSNARQ